MASPKKNIPKTVHHKVRPVDLKEANNSSFFSNYRWLSEFFVILCLCFITYGNAIKNDYNLDDAYVVSLDDSNQQTKMGIRGIPEILFSNYNVGEGISYGYRPMGKVTMAIEYSLWGNNPHYSHAVNIILYAFNIFLLLLFIRKVSVMFNYENKTVEYLSVLLFIVHPIHTEVVCSIKNREEILCYIFVLSAVLVFFKYMEKKRLIYIFPITILSLLAFWSKQSAVNIFGIIFLVIFFSSYLVGMWQRNTIWWTRKDIWKKIAGNLLGLFKYALLLMVISAPILIILAKLVPEIIFNDILYLYTILIIICLIIPERILAVRSAKGGEFIHSDALLYIPTFIFFLNVMAWIKMDIDESSVTDVIIAIVCMGLLLTEVILFTRRFIKSKPNLFLFIVQSAKSRVVKWTVLVGVAIVAVFSVAYMVMNFIPSRLDTSYTDVAFEQNPYYYSPLSHLFPNSIQTLFFYIKKLFIPYPLGYYYGYNMLPSQGWDSIYPYIGIALIISISTFVIYCLWNRTQLYLLFWIMLFAGSLLPFINLVKGKFFTGIVGERMAYQASAAFCIVLAIFVYKLAEFVYLKFFQGKKHSIVKTAYSFSALIVLPFLLITANRNTKWKDMATLFQNDIAYLSNSARANLMIAGNYMNEAIKDHVQSPDRKNNVSKAKMHLLQALTVYPLYDDAWLGLGNIYYLHEMKMDSAMYCLNKVTKAKRHEFVKASELMGDISYLVRKDRVAALTYYLRGFNMNNKSDVLYGKAVQVLFETEDFNKVVPLAEIAVKNGWEQGYLDLGDAHYNSGDTLSAIVSYEQAIIAGLRGDQLIGILARYYQANDDNEKLRWLQNEVSN